jgi:hypothetical protein
MASFWEYLTGATKQRDPRLNLGYSEASDALADFQAASEGYSPPTGLTGPLRLGMDAVYGVSQIPNLYKMLTGTGVGAVQSTSEGFPFYQSEESSDRMGRDLMALTNEAPVDLFIAPSAGTLSKAGEFGEMSKKSLPYLLGQKLDDAPDTANLRPKGIPAGVTIPNEGRFSARPIAEIQRITENYIKEAGLDGAEYLVYPELDAQRAKLIAAAYQRMKNDPENEEVAASYQAMIDETMAQYNALKDAGIDFKFLKEGEPDPYADSPAAGYKDLIENRRLYVFPTDQGYGSDIPAPDVSYRINHQPTGPLDEDAIRLDNLTKSITGEQAGYPEDFYSSQGPRYYAPPPRHADDEYGIANQESYEVISSVFENPDAEVMIYRAVPKNINDINSGDWITLSPKYAELHAASGYGPRGDEAGKVISQKVKVKDIYWGGDDVNEFGYFPEGSSQPEIDMSKNPMLTPVGKVGDKEDAVANDAFRIVHDVFGHLGAGNPQFRAAGEERAFLEHSRMYSPLARKAMASETRGQNSTVNSGMYADLNEGASGADTIYADQKIGLMPDWAVDPKGMPDPVDRLELEEIIRNWPR